MKKILKWQGSKTWIFNDYKDRIEQFKNVGIIELFGGSQALSFQIEPEYQIINDTNVHLINFYNQLKHSNLFIDDSIQWKRDKELYLKYRKEFNDNILRNDIYTLRMQRLFYYLNKTGFNGLIRFNKKGLFNVSYGHSSDFKDPSYYFEEDKVRELIKKWDFLNLDYRQVKNFNDKMLLLIDPPYVDTEMSYIKDKFTMENQIEVIDYIQKFNNPIIYTNHINKELMHKLFKNGFKIIERIVNRSVNPKQQRKQKEFMQIRNIKLNESLNQLEMF